MSWRYGIPVFGRNVSAVKNHCIKTLFAPTKTVQSFICVRRPRKMLKKLLLAWRDSLMSGKKDTRRFACCYFVITFKKHILQAWFMVHK